MQNARTHYAVRFRLRGIERFLIWYTNEIDGVLLSAPDRIRVFRNLVDLEQHAAQERLKLEEEAISLYDFDRLSDWLSNPIQEGPDCPFLLNAWNMLGDVARSLGVGLAEPKGVKDVYDKLFWGSNLPSVTPPGEQFLPRWSREDLSALTAVLSSGLDVMRGAVRHVA